MNIFNFKVIACQVAIPDRNGMNFKTLLLGLTILTLGGCYSNAQRTTNTVKVVGQMKDVMWKGQLYGNINLDTIANKTNLYGLGPVEYLAGEILIIDGKYIAVKGYDKKIPWIYAVDYLTHDIVHSDVFPSEYLSLGGA